MATVFCGEIPDDDRSREFRIVQNDRKMCDKYFIQKYAIGEGGVLAPDSFRYWERVVCQRGGRAEAGELVPGVVMNCPFEVDHGADAYDAKEQTYQVNWKI